MTAVKAGQKIIHNNTPETLSHKINTTRSTNESRMSGKNKMGHRPRNFGGGQCTRNQFRAKIYAVYNTIPKQIQNIKAHHRLNNDQKST